MSERFHIILQVAFHNKPPFLWSERLVILQYSHSLVHGLPSDVLAEGLFDSVGAIRGCRDDDAGAFLVNEVRSYHVDNRPNLDCLDTTVNVNNQKRATLY